MRASSKLSTPLSSSSPEPSLFRGGLILFWVAFAGYLTLITPGIYWRDAGELTASAFGLGVAHPTGFSAYVIMAKLATFVPLGSIAFRVNLLSSVCGGAAVSLAYVLMVRFAGDRTRMTRWSAGAGALLLAWGSTFWLHSTTAEVYAPNLLVTLALIWYGLEVIERVPLILPPNPSNARYLRTKQQKMGHLLGLKTEALDESAPIGEVDHAT